MRYNNRTLQEFAARFQHPFLREAVRLFIDAPGWPMPDFPMPVLAGFIRSGVTQAGAPLGGSQQVAFQIADLYKQLGGSIYYKSRVSDLTIEKNRVTGIRLNDGTEHKADRVIWAGDGHTLIYDILEGKYIDEKITDRYKNWIPVKPIVHVMLGVNRDFSKEPHRFVLELEKPFVIGSKQYKWINTIHHSFDPSMAPEGKSVVEMWFDTDYAFWQELAGNKEKYKAEKERIAAFSIAQLEKRWPGIASQIEVTDVPTPVTYTRYTGNWQGSPDGWYITPTNFTSMEPLRTLPGLDNLYMAGQWTAPFTGTIIAALTGRQLIQLMCKRDGKKFFTNYKKQRILN
jgi:phytoene dehydrogenase-like protein